MTGLAKRAVVVLSLAGFAASADWAVAADRSADEILKELESVVVPKRDSTKTSDSAYVRNYVAQTQKANAKRCELILELYKVAPDHEKLVRLLPERWAMLPRAGEQGKATYHEVEGVVAHTKNEKIKIEGVYIKAVLKLAAARQSGQLDLADLNEFARLAPKDPRTPAILYSSAGVIKDAKQKAALEDRIFKEYPDSKYAVRIKGERRKQEGLGKPFDLEFTDAIKGSTVSMKALKGKVVVIDFWATWCGPCVQEMPRMKELYAKYHDQGVEFIGVSLDRPKEMGGLDRLKRFVADHEIAWPQYYQGNFWDSEFSRSWGINLIPTMFLVNQDGKLVSVDALEHLETLITDLLNNKEAAAGAGAGAGGQ